MEKSRIRNQIVRNTFFFLFSIFSIFLLDLNKGEASHISGHTTSDFIPHGSYTTNTNSCGKCHQIHLAQGANLLQAANKRDTCFLCHDGTGSNYNIKAGKYASANGYVDTVAGGFDPKEGFTSTHLIEKTNIPPGGDGELQLVCTSCHNPHGTTNHRLLRTTVNGTPDVTVTAKKSISSTSNKEIISYDDYSSTNNGIPKLCTSCHEDYIQYSSNNVLNGNLNYRHRMNMSLRGGSSITYSPSLTTTLPLAGTPSSVDATFTTSTSGALTNSTVYKYQVSAYNDNGETIGSQEITITGNTVASQNYTNNTGQGKSVTITWKSITNAKGYYIYRKIGAASYQKATVDDTVTSFTDSGTTTIPSGLTWTNDVAPPREMAVTFTTSSASGSFADGSVRKYIVTAVNAKGESVANQEITITGSATALQTGWKGTGRQITINWTSVTNATGYYIYRNVSSDGITWGGYQKSSQLLSTATSFNDTGSATTPSLTWSTGSAPASTNERVVCITCHYAHGTKTNDAFTGQSKLKRIDNMGVCQNCHKR